MTGRGYREHALASGGHVGASAAFHLPPGDRKGSPLLGTEAAAYRVGAGLAPALGRRGAVGVPVARTHGSQT